MKKNIFNCFLTVCICAGVVSCASVHEENAEVYVPLNYTENDVVASELNRIAELSDEQSVKALWRLELLKENSGAENSPAIQEKINQRIEKIKEQYEAFLKDGKYFEALSIYNSLANCSPSSVEKLEKNEQALETSVFVNTPGIKGDSKEFEAERKVSEFIRGTVTVFVDKGIKIEHGVGRADAVLGSGFFISKDGYIVTNNHVITDCVDPKYEGFSRLYIRMADDPDTRVPAKVVGYDSVLDLALLKAEVDAPYVFTLGSSTALDAGTKVYAIGSPLGLERTLTSGIVSAVDRKLFTLGNVFQIDAAVNSGNSGGPLIDEKGRVQAIVFAGVPNYQGLNFAIPVEYLRFELPLLFNGGKREHPWIGAYGRTKKSSGASPKNEGLEIQYVMPGGMASLCGISAGDVVTGIDDVTVNCLEDLQHYFMTKPVDSVCRIRVTGADGVEKEKLIYLEKRPASPGYEIYRHDVIALSFLPITGMELAPLSTSNKRKYSVVKVLKGSVADETGFSEHDPVDLIKVDFNDEKTAVYVELYTKKRKNGYMDMNIGFAAPLDSPYYF